MSGCWDVAPCAGGHPNILTAQPGGRGAYISNSELTESSLWIRLIASASSPAMESVFSFGQSCILSVIGMLLVATTRSSRELLMRVTAGPESTACVEEAEI